MIKQKKVKKEVMKDHEVIDKLTSSLEEGYPKKKEKKGKKDGVDELTEEQMAGYPSVEEDDEGMEGYDDDMEMDDDEKKEGKKPQLFKSAPSLHLTISMASPKKKGMGGRYA